MRETLSVLTATTQVRDIAITFPCFFPVFIVEWTDLPNSGQVGDLNADSGR